MAVNAIQRDGALARLLLEPTTLGVRILHDGRVVALRQQLFNYLLTVGSFESLVRGEYDDEWEYSQTYYEQAFAFDAITAEAFVKWDGIGEPKRWTRHRPSGRRRWNGNPEQEEVRR